MAAGPQPVAARTPTKTAKHHHLQASHPALTCRPNMAVSALKRPRMPSISSCSRSSCSDITFQTAMKWIEQPTVSRACGPSALVAARPAVDLFCRSLAFKHPTLCRVCRPSALVAARPAVLLFLIKKTICRVAPLPATRVHTTHGPQQGLGWSLQRRGGSCPDLWVAKGEVSHHLLQRGDALVHSRAAKNAGRQDTN